MINTITNTYNDARNTRWQNAWEYVINENDIYRDISADWLSIDVSDSLINHHVFAVIIVVNKTIFNSFQLSNSNQTIESVVQEVIDRWNSQNAKNLKIININECSENTLSSDKINLSDILEVDTLDQSNITVKSDRLSDVMTMRCIMYSTDIQRQQKNNTQQDIINSSLIDAVNKSFDDCYQSCQNNDIIDNNGVDCHVLPLSTVLTTPKMACFDMDSTLIEQEVIVEIAKETGIGEHVNEITESAMRGEIDFNESFEKRVKLLHGTEAHVLDTINQRLVLSAGAMTTLAVLNALGCHTVLLSGGFTYFAKVIASKLNINEYHANILLVDDNKVVGEAQYPIVDGQRKADLVQKIAQEQGIELNQVICVGDGANDLNMMAIAHLGIAYHAKPIVQKQADTAINCTGLEGVLYALGFSAISV